MSKNHHDKPFDEGTITKLTIFEKYLEEWLPVFFNQKYSKIYIADFFAGPGTDNQGTYGSPLRIIDKLYGFKANILKNHIQLEVIFNEFDRDKFDNLNENIESVREKLFYKPKIRNNDFKDIFEELKPELEINPALLFIDQNGIKQVTEDIFTTLINFKRVDFLFFISSSYFARFYEEPSFKKNFPTICEDDIKGTKYYSIHRKILEHYRKMLPPNSKLSLIPFSIKKSSQIYGLIFGTHHILGAEKFLNITWKENNINGEANFDIDDDLTKMEQRVLFTEYEKKTKLQEFEENLTQYISNKGTITNREIFDFSITNGFIHKHAKDIVNKLIAEGKLKKMFTGTGIYLNYKPCYKEEPKKFQWIG